MLKIQGIIKQGYRVGSGTSEVDDRFNEDGGTIRLQIGEFRQRGLDFDDYFGGPPDEAYVCGTLGVSIAPHTYTIWKPEYHFTGVRWTHKHDRPGEPSFTEDFYMSPARVSFGGSDYKALLYMPDMPAPETKPDHFHPPTMIEVIAQTIANITYGDTVELSYNPDAIVVK